MTSYLIMCANSPEYQAHLKKKEAEEENMTEEQAEDHVEGIEEATTKEQNIEEDNDMVKLIGEE